MHCICCGTTLSDTTIICLSCGTDLSGANQAIRKRVSKNTRRSSGNRLTAFAVAAAILSGIFVAGGIWLGFSVDLLLFFGAWLAVSGLGFYSNWSFINAFGGGLIAVVGMLTAWIEFDNIAEVPDANTVLVTQARARAAAFAPRAKSINEWATTIKRNSTPEQVRHLLGRPSSTSESGTDLEDGSKQLLIYDYAGLAIGQRSGQLEILRIAFMSGSAHAVQEGRSGRKLELSK